MSGSGDFYKNMYDLDILPSAISYEFEPCDGLKAKELFISRRHTYVKIEGEDLNSILTGISSWKGRIRICFTEPILPSEVEYCAKFEKNEKFHELGKIIDRQIHSAYHLWPNNYIAEDILAEREGREPLSKGKFSKAAKETFMIHMQERLEAAEAEIIKEEGLEFDDSMRKELEDIFLHIYANPIGARKADIKA